MKILEVSRGVILEVYIKPGADFFQLKIEDNKLKMWCHERPIKGKVNKKILKQFSRIFDRKIELISGFSSTQKKILINDINIDEVIRILNSI